MGRKARRLPMGPGPTQNAMEMVHFSYFGWILQARGARAGGLRADRCKFVYILLGDLLRAAPGAGTFAHFWQILG